MSATTHYNGFRAKTVNIRTYTGSTKFNLQQSVELGLPEGSVIVGVMVRQQSSDKKASNLKDLVAVEVFQNAYLNLKSHKQSQGIALILENVYLPHIVDRAVLFEPIESRCIDWNGSFISINKRALPDLVDNRMIELVILYRECDENIHTLPTCFHFRTGTQLLGTRRARKEIDLIPGESQYPLSGSPNIGLPREAWLVGFTTRESDFPLSGELMANSAFTSSYLTLKRKTDLFVDSFPVELENYQDVLFPDLDYFPIEPTKVLDLDWEASQLSVNKDTAGLSGQVFQIEFIYVMVDENGIMTTGGYLPNLGQ